MAEAPNPFGALINTPEVLDLRRRAEFAQQTTGMDFWAQEAGRAGLNLRRGLLEQGLAISPEDERALQTQHIMRASQQRLAALVQSGEVTPMDAQEQVITETMSAFMAAGDYEAAQSLLPGLNQIRTYRLEQEKLRTEGVENLATANKDNAAAGLSDTRAVVAAARAPAQIAADEANASLRLAGARLKDRTDPNIRASARATAAASRVGPAEQREIRQAMAGTITLFDTMNDLIQMVEQAPWVASTAAGAHTDVQQFLTGQNKYFQSLGKGREVWNLGALSDDPAQARSDDGGSSSLSPRQIAAANEARVRAAADRLGVDVTVFRSSVINAAYALARSNDPGGRLSNNDFDFALQMLGAVEDPAAARAAFANLARQGYDKHKARMRSIDSESREALFGEQIADIDATYEAFKQRYGQLGAQPAPTLTKEEIAAGWQLTPSGAKVRVKK